MENKLKTYANSFVVENNHKHEKTEKEIKNDVDKIYKIDTSHSDLISLYPPNGYGDGSVC
jgi:hypothetical protein